MDLKQKLDASKIKTTTVPERIPRLKPAVHAVLQEQIKNELYSSQLYRGMASYLDDAGWNSASKVFFKYADEELKHMNKIYEYLYDRNCKAQVPSCDGAPIEYTNIRDILTKGLEHEIMVSEQWENIAKTACGNDDKTTVDFARWFHEEQIEEENKMRDMLDLLNLGMPDWALEAKFEEMLG